MNDNDRMFHSKEYRIAQRSKMVLYGYLRARIIREAAPGLSMVIYENFYLTGRLAVTASLRELAADFEYTSMGSVRSFIAQLHADKIIQLEAIHVGKTRPQTVFILGTHDETGEHYFIEEVYLKQA